MQDALESVELAGIALASPTSQAWCCLPTEEAFDGIVRCGDESLRHWSQFQQYLPLTVRHTCLPLNHRELGELEGLCIQPIWRPQAGRA